MMVSRLHQLLTTPVKRGSDPQTLLWLGFSLAIALLYSLLALRETLGEPYIIQDDARQHVFWMQRFIDPGLFPNDWIADYFQSVAPAGYTAVYRLAALVGLDPMTFHKVLPIGLNLLIAGLCFSVSLRLFPIPAAAFTATVLLGQGLGLTDAVVSATPKAFVYPLLLLFMDGVLRGNWMLTTVAIALQGLFYPQLVFIASGVLVLRVLRWQDGRLGLVTERGDRRLILAGLGMAVLVLLPYALQSDAFGPTLTLAEARSLPELSDPLSRARYFVDDDPAAYWLEGRSGLRLATALTPVTNAAGLLLPLLMVLSGAFPLVRLLRPNLLLLPQLLVSSLAMFGLAHLLLFRLHLPSRYTQHSFRVVLSLAAAIALVTLMDGVIRWANAAPPQRRGFRSSRWPWRSLIAAVVAAVLSLAVLAYPAFVQQFPITAYQVGRATGLYEWLRSQPESVRIASLSDEANNLPSFAQRSVLVAEEYAIPYHWGYYQEFRQRVFDLTLAQYSTDPEQVRSVIQTYGIDLWMLDRQAFKPDYLANRIWVQQYPALAEVMQTVAKSGDRPILSRMVRPCTVFRGYGKLVLDAQCVLERLPD